jgi:hypothetical protein
MCDGFVITPISSEPSRLPSGTLGTRGAAGCGSAGAAILATALALGRGAASTSCSTVWSLLMSPRNKRSSSISAVASLLCSMITPD